MVLATRFHLVAAALTLTLAACASQQNSSGGQVPTAEDLVCKYNGDLACVTIPITPQTPSYDYKGTTYYFCSPECKAAFIKDPEKYLAQAK